MSSSTVSTEAARSAAARLVEEFPRRWGETARGTAGLPSAVTVSGDGARVVFLRSDEPTSRAGALWVFDCATGTERCVAEPAALGAGADAALPPEERARRERLRQGGSGIAAFSLDAMGERAVFALGGACYLAELSGAAGKDEVRLLPTGGPAVDPRLSPDGRRVAYVTGGALHVLGLESGADERWAGEGDAEPTVTWGLADFAAAEELGRSRGFWWAPESDVLLVARVDEAEVRVAFLADASQPEAAPVAHRYPFAGTENAEVRLFRCAGPGKLVEIAWDRDAFPYLAAVRWDPGRSAVVQVLSRDQRNAAVLAVPAGTPPAQTVVLQRDPDWVDVVPGVPAFDGRGRLLTVGVTADCAQLRADGVSIGPRGVQVRAVRVDGETIFLEGAADPADCLLWRLDPSTGDEAVPVEAGQGIHHLAVAGGTLAVTSSTLASGLPETVVWRAGERVGVLGSAAAAPGRPPTVHIERLPDRGRRSGPRPVSSAVRVGVVFPSWHEPGSARLPVLLDPYGGPHASRVVHAGRAWLEPAFFAEAGLAVVVADGRGTPGSPAAERAVGGDLATPALEDQLVALDWVLSTYPDLDPERVAIRGWSFGGYLAALALLRRPDRIAAAIAGAPVTDWRLYDTAYTERYLGCDPEGADRAAYDASGLLGLAPTTRRPLLVIHGLADDNVLVAHSLRLSAALFARGYPHRFVPLAGITHMTPQPRVVEALLRLQLDFLVEALGVLGPGASTGAGGGEGYRAAGPPPAPPAPLAGSPAGSLGGPPVAPPRQSTEPEEPGSDRSP